MTQRAKLIERLERQKALAQDPSFAPTVRRWKKGADGTKQIVESKRPIKPWWLIDVTRVTLNTNAEQPL
jgi:hypothetical protein